VQDDITRPQLEALSASRAEEVRMLAGFLLRPLLPREGERVWPVADHLVVDDAWTVREAATFGTRDASIDDPDAVLPLLRRWAEPAVGARRHRAFIVVARQPARQRASVVAEIMASIDEPLADPDPYVRKNIPFAIRYLARNQPRALRAKLAAWVTSQNVGLERAALAALAAGALDDPASLLAALTRSPNATTRRAAQRLRST